VSQRAREGCYSFKGMTIDISLRDILANSVLIYENKHACCRQPPPSFITLKLFSNQPLKNLAQKLMNAKKHKLSFLGCPQRETRGHYSMKLNKNIK